MGAETEQAGRAHYVHRECDGLVMFDLSGGFCVRCHAEGLDAEDVERGSETTAKPPVAESLAPAPRNPAASTWEPSSGNDGGAPSALLAASREGAGALLAGCPTPCDPDCELNPDGCHESHNPVHKRWHDPGWSCGEVQRAIAEAVSTEKTRTATAEARLAAIADHCRERMNAPGRSGMTRAAAETILGLAEGSDEKERTQ